MKETLKGVTEDCLVFWDRIHKVNVKVIPLDKVYVLPRVGELLYLPGTDGEGGQYRVQAIEHRYSEDSESPLTERGDVRLAKIIVEVTKLPKAQPQQQQFKLVRPTAKSVWS